MKYLLIFIIGYHVTVQITDYNELVRYSECTLKTNDYDECSKPEKSSELYNFLLKTEIPRLADCVLPSGEDNILCKIFRIKRSI